MSTVYLPVSVSFRDVIPDHYKIVLDIISDQYTVASMDTCQPTEDKPCPEGYQEGDSYLNRNLYIKCPYTDGQVSCQIYGVTVSSPPPHFFSLYM